MKMIGGLARDLIGVFGAGCIVYGVSLMYLPGAWIVGGCFILAASIAHAMGEP